MATSDISDSDFEEKVVKDKNVAFVDFWAEWCGPCKLADPVIEELSDKYPGKIDFFKMDVDKNPLTPAKFAILSIPTTLLFKGGKEIGRQVGFSGKQAYEELIKKGVI